MLRAALCLLLLAVAAIAVRPPVVADCCAVERSGCCGPVNACCRIAPAPDAATAPDAPAVQPEAGRELVAVVDVAPCALDAAAPQRADLGPPPAGGAARSHLALSILRV